MKFNLSRNEIKAALLFASDDDARYVITGVNVELAIKAAPILVTTDGRRLAVIKTLATQPEGQPDGEASFILRAEFCEAIFALSKAIGGKLNPWIEFDYTVGHKSIACYFVGAKCNVITEEGAIIEGLYPNWRQIMPSKKAEREPINDLGLNADFMADYGKVAKIMEADTPVIQMNLVGKDRAIEVRLASLPSFYGLVMPCKADETLEYQPEFVTITKAFPVVAKAEKDEEEKE